MSKTEGENLVDDEAAAAKAAPRKRARRTRPRVEVPEEVVAIVEEREDPTWWAPYAVLVVLVLVGFFGFFGAFNGPLGFLTNMGK
jgi:hypothetical protein